MCFSQVNSAWENLNKTWKERVERLEEAMQAAVQFQDGLQVFKRSNLNEFSDFREWDVFKYGIFGYVMVNYLNPNVAPTADFFIMIIFYLYILYN